MSMLSEQLKTTLIKAALFAPSADNSQPWQYSWEDDSLLLWRDPALSGEATDRSFVLTDLAIGCVIENIRLGAAISGYQAQVTLLPQKVNDLLCARVSFIQSTQQADAQTLRLAEHISIRCTDRRFPFTGPIPEEVVQTLNNCSSDANIQITTFTERKKIARLSAIIKRAEAIRFKSAQLHAELFNTVQFNNLHPEQGMTTDMLGIEPPAKPFFRMISKWSAMDRLNTIGAANLIAARSVTLPVRLSPALCVLTTKRLGREAMLIAGQQMQRFWLTATASGLSVHPYAAPGVLTLAQPDLPETIKPQLSQVAADLEQQFNAENHAVMFFRIGYKKGQPVRSLRRNADKMHKQ